MSFKMPYVALALVLISLFLSTSCTKDKVPPPPEPTKWEKMAGDYKVYDTLGGYLYDMTLVAIDGDGSNNDSIRFENFDGEFTFTSIQINAVNYPMNVRIGVHDLLIGNQGNRWYVGSGLYEEYNYWSNDTIRLRFHKTNINYYIQDLTPYFDCDCKQIAVKQ